MRQAMKSRPMKLYELKDYESKHFGHLHHMYVHHRADAFLMGAGGFLIGTTLLGIILNWPIQPAVSASLLIIFFLVHLYKTNKVCRCGRDPVLNSKTRDELRSMQIRRWPYRILHSIVNDKVLLFLLLLGTATSLCNILSFHLFTIYSMCALSLLFGTYALYCSARNIRPLYVQSRTIQESEREIVEALKGETEEELARIVDFCMKAGEYENAEFYSAKLLKLADHNKRQEL